MWSEICDTITLETRNESCTISGEALDLIEDFIKYSELDMDAMADLMWYDIDGFKWKLARLKKEIDYKKECD